MEKKPSRLGCGIMGSIRLLFGWRTEMGSDPSHFLFG